VLSEPSRPQVLEQEAVSIRAFEPPALSDKRRQEIVDRLKDYFAEVDASRKPVSPEEADEAVTEAIRSTRLRNPASRYFFWNGLGTEKTHWYIVRLIRLPRQGTPSGVPAGGQHEQSALAAEGKPQGLKALYQSAWCLRHA
jgi:hypothetical protein